MARISDEDIHDIKRYAWRKGIFGEIPSHCNSREEIDAVEQCLFIIKENFNDYQHAVGVAPKYREKTLKELQNKLSEAHTLEEAEDILQEWKAVSPWHSQVKEIKNSILDECREVLKNAKIGKKRIDKIMPELTWYLLYDDDLFPDENEDIEELIKSF